MPKKIAVLAATVLGCCWALPAAAQDAAGQFYRGKTVTIVVGTTVGGPYDAYARLLGRYLGKHLPGEPTVIVTNMPGASGQVASTYVARVAAKDGTFIDAPNASEPLLPILQDVTGLNFDPSRLNYLGRAASSDWLCIVRSDAPATFDDMFKTPVIMGGTTGNNVDGYLPIMLNNVLGTKFKVVLGYPGAAEVMSTMEKGEIQGRCGLGWSSLKSGRPDLLRNGEIKVVVQVSDTGLPELNEMGVPLIGSYAHDEQQRRILEIIESQEVFAFPYFVATEVPADRLQMLRRAFIETWRDPDLLADAAKMNLDVDPASGEEIQALLQKVYASPPALLQSVKEALKPK